MTEADALDNRAPRAHASCAPDPIAPDSTLCASDSTAPASDRASRALPSRREMLVMSAASAALVALPSHAFADALEEDAAAGANYTDGDEATLDTLATTPITWSEKNGVWTSSSGMTVDDAYAFGIDVSKWQGTIDWSSVKSDGVQFAIIRTGHGQTVVDEQLSNNVSGCKKCGIPFGIYHYSTAASKSDAAKEAAICLDLLDDAGVEPEDLKLPVYFDMESSTTSAACSSASDFANIAKGFCDAIEDAGFEAGVYANYYWWTTYLTSSTFEQWSRWVARYNTYCGYEGSYDLWQCSSSGYVEGISSTYVDIDFLYSSYTCDFTSLYGDTRYDTAAAIIEEAYGSETSEYAVVASGANYPDALAASALAGALGAPVVLAKSASTTEVLSVIEDMGVNKVYVVGGTAALSSFVLSKLRAKMEDAGGFCVRLAGSTRQGTAIAVEAELRNVVSELGISASKTAIVASGANFPDALAASPYAYWSHSPIFLTKTNGTLSDETVAAIEEGGYSLVVALGGSKVVSTASLSELTSLDGVSVKRIFGDNRYETAAAMAEWSVEQGMGWDDCAIATGKKFPDALVGATLCGRKGSVMLLASGSNTSAATSALNAVSGDIENLYFLGGSSAISTAVRKKIKNVFVVYTL